MKKKNWKDTLAWLGEKLSFLKLDMDEDEEEELEIEERAFAPGRELPEGDPKQRLERSRRQARHWRIFLASLIVIIAGSFFLYNQLHVFQDYVITASKSVEAVSGTKYLSVGKKLYRYNSDGVSCISRTGDTEWSVTYSMQAPIADLCDGTMVIAEQQGTQVYIVNRDGLLGNFETQIPILKARVSRQGVVALVLQDDTVTWVNLYQADGTSVATDKTTVGESGYPLDVALSPNGQKMAVSYLKMAEGVMTDEVVFYHFGAAGKDKTDNIVSRTEYTDEVIPQIYFTDDAHAVGVSDSGYHVFSGSNAPEESTSVQFEKEIISSFHDAERIGFLFLNDDGDEQYRMELYNYSGRKKSSAKIDAKFDEIKIENGQILMYNDKGFDVFSKSGHQRFSSAYEKEVEGFFYFGEYRKYLVISKDSFDKIRIG